MTFKDSCQKRLYMPQKTSLPDPIGSFPDLLQWSSFTTLSAEPLCPLYQQPTDCSFNLILTLPKMPINILANTIIRIIRQIINPVNTSEQMFLICQKALTGTPYVKPARRAATFILRIPSLTREINVSTAPSACTAFPSPVFFEQLHLFCFVIFR